MFCDCTAMAEIKSESLSRSFRNDPRLKQYYLDGVVPTNNTLGVGCYGSVVEVEYSKVSCAAKRIHEVLFDLGNQGVQEIIRTYRRECQLMAGLRHPNITQFLGLCFLEGSELPLLVMEKLEMSVNDLLEYIPNIPLPVKVSILTDTCSGLLYLHGRPSPIVHRDLTARNVLLTAALTAKITDIGNSRIVNLRPSQLAQTMSKVPGTLDYLPPEALDDSYKYGRYLDIFSFGHLALYVLTQVFPRDLLSVAPVDPHNSGEVVGHSEVKRREVYMKKLENQLLVSHPILVELVSNCLHNNPLIRPSTEQLHGTLQLVKKEMDRLYDKNLWKTIDIGNALQIMEIKQKEQRIHELEISKAKLEAIISERTETIRRQENEQRRLKAANTKISSEKNEAFVNHKKYQLKADSNIVQGENTQLRTENSQLKSENTQLKFENDKPNSSKIQLEHEKVLLESHYQQEKHSLQMEVKRLTGELQRTCVTGHDNKKSVKQKPTASEVRLVAENADLIETNTRLENDKRSLESTNTQITLEKNQAIHNFDQLEDEIRRVQVENTVMIVENTQLKAENKQLQTEKKQLKIESNQLKAEINQLKIKNHQLKAIEMATASMREQQVEPTKSSYKMVMMGETGSGKTSFLQLLLNYAKQFGSEEYSLDQVTPFITSESKEPTEKKESWESDTTESKKYTAQYGDFTLDVIDTPGFGEFRYDQVKINIANVIATVKKEPYINCVCLIINGSQLRMTTVLKTVLTQIVSLLPPDFLQNIIVVFTGTRDELCLKFDVDIFKVFQLSIQRNNYFLIDNPYSRFKSLPPMADKKLLKRLQRSFEDAHETLDKMFEVVKNMKPVITLKFGEFQEAVDDMKVSFTRLRVHYWNKKEIQKLIEHHHICRCFMDKVTYEDEIKVKKKKLSEHEADIDKETHNLVSKIVKFQFVGSYFIFSKNAIEQIELLKKEMESIPNYKHREIISVLFDVYIDIINDPTTAKKEEIKARWACGILGLEDSGKLTV